MYGKPATPEEVDVDHGYFRVDMQNRICVCKNVEPFNVNIHGPAVTCLSTRPYIYDHDFVLSYRCMEWPKSAKRWLCRSRLHNWPSSTLIKEMKSKGHFVVPVGHYASPECDKEWRISLSLQERLLIYSLNPTQHKCYVLLKMVKDILLYFVGVESISSYHCKTCLFYTIENTPGHFWQPKKLFSCLQMCLMRLHTWVVEGVCPNYFIPEENMFERRNFPEIKEKLSSALWMLVTSNCGYLIQIRCEEIGKWLGVACLRGLAAIEPLFETHSSIITLYLNSFQDGTRSRNMMLRECVDDDQTECLHNHSSMITRLISIDSVTEYDDDDIRDALYLLTPHIKLSYLSTVVSLAQTDAALKCLGGENWGDLKSTVVAMPSVLKQAMFLYMFGYFEQSLYSLEHVDKPADDVLISCCACTYLHTQVPIQVYEEVSKQNLSKQELHLKYVIPCTAFLPSEKGLIPEPLAYEMERSKNTGTARKSFEFWFDWAVVDSKFLFYFLLYINHAQLQNHLPMCMYTAAMEALIDKDPNLAHKETDLNLLGWVYKQEGRLRNAMACFKDSLTVKESHNAAILHMREMDEIFEAVKVAVDLYIQGMRL